MRHGLREILAISALFVPASAQAHPGPHREELLWSLVHAVTQGDHIAAMAATGFGAAIFVALAALPVARKSRAPAR